MDSLPSDKLKRAKRRVERLKGFYMHLTSYCLINTFILVNIYLDTVSEGGNFWQWEHFFVLFAWGFGLAIHATRVFAVNPFLGENWEKRQIEKIMEKERRDAEKFK